MCMCCVYISCMGMVYTELSGEEGGGRGCGLAGGCDVSPPAVHTNNKSSTCTCTCTLTY